VEGIVEGMISPLDKKKSPVDRGLVGLCVICLSQNHQTTTGQAGENIV
jgi:uncharacterized protein YejL (UPF0352 family)